MRQVVVAAIAEINEEVRIMTLFTTHIHIYSFLYRICLCIHVYCACITCIHYRIAERD